MFTMQIIYGHIDNIKAGYTKVNASWGRKGRTRGTEAATEDSECDNKSER